MKKPVTKTFVLYVGNPDDEAGQRAALTLTAPIIESGSHHADLFDEQHKPMAAVVWNDDVKVREI
jgi:hypothetical protein